MVMASTLAAQKVEELIRKFLETKTATKKFDLGVLRPIIFRAGINIGDFTVTRILKKLVDEQLVVRVDRTHWAAVTQATQVAAAEGARLRKQLAELEARVAALEEAFTKGGGK